MGIVLTSEDLERALDEFRLKIGDLQQRIEVLELAARANKRVDHPAWDNTEAKEHRWSEEDFRAS